MPPLPFLQRQMPITAASAEMPCCDCSKAQHAANVAGPGRTDALFRRIQARRLRSNSAVNRTTIAGEPVGSLDRRNLRLSAATRFSSLSVWFALLSRRSHFESTWHAMLCA
jgi:hypothetical protein